MPLLIMARIVLTVKICVRVQWLLRLAFGRSSRELTSPSMIGIMMAKWNRSLFSMPVKAKPMVVQLLPFGLTCMLCHCQIMAKCCSLMGLRWILMPAAVN